MFKDAISIYKPLVLIDSQSVDYQLELAKSYHITGNVLKARERLKDAESAYTSALSLQHKLANHHPKVPKYRDELAKTALNFGALQSLLGDESHRVTARSNNYLSPANRLP